jgi:hypothetical protein
MMNKFKRAAAVAAMVAGTGLVGGVAHADVIVDNLQVAECDQQFDGGTGVAEEPPTLSGDAIGDFCTVTGSED